MTNTLANGVTVNESIIKDGSMLLDLSHGKTSAFVAITHRGVQVVVNNASHRAWQRAGKFFPTIEAAIASYKTASMRAILAAADSINH